MARSSLASRFADFVSPWRAAKIRKHVENKIPIEPEGKKLTPDLDAVDGLLDEAFRQHPPLVHTLKNLFARMTGGKARDYEPLPETRRTLRRALIRDFRRAVEPLAFDARELARKNHKSRQRILMTSPDQLTAGQSLDERIATMEKWLSAHHALLKAGARIEIMPSTRAEGGYREVYTRDRFIMINRTAYLPDWRKLQKDADDGTITIDQSEVDNYKGEILQVEAELRKQGVKTVIVKGAWFEGGNVNRFLRRATLVMGIDPPWATKDSARKLLKAVNETQPRTWRMICAPLANADEMYHMDTGMSEELPNGEVMISPLVTDERTYRNIVRIVGDDDVIELSDKEAKALATNLMTAGRTIVMTGHLPGLRKKLEERGYEVVMPGDYRQKSFEFGLGGVHCMTNDVPPPKP